MWFCFLRGIRLTTHWDYAVREAGRECPCVTDLDELTGAAGKVEVVLALNLNELGHSVSPLVQVLRALVTHDVALIVPSRGIDTSSVPGKVILGMLRPPAAKEGQETAFLAGNQLRCYRKNSGRFNRARVGKRPFTRNSLRRLASSRLLCFSSWGRRRTLVEGQHANLPNITLTDINR